MLDGGAAGDVDRRHRARSARGSATARSCRSPRACARTAAADARRTRCAGSPPSSTARGRWVEQPELAAHDRRDAPPRARRRGLVRGRTASASATAGSRSSTSPPAGTSRCRTRTGRSGSPTTASSTTTASCARELVAARAPLPLAQRHRGRRSTPTRSGATTACERFDGMFAFARLGRARAAPDRSRATASASSRSTDASTTAGWCSARRSRSLLAAGVPRRVDAAGARRVLHLPERLLRPDAVRRACARFPPGTCSRPTQTAVEVEPLLGPRVRARRVALAEASGASDVREALEAAVDRQLVSDVPVGSYLSGGMDSGSLVALASRRAPRLMTFTGGFDLTSVERARARLRRARVGASRSRAASAPSTTRWSCTRATWPGCCPTSSGTSRTCASGMCYQNHYVARLASKFVKVALVGRRRRRALRRLSVALRARRGPARRRTTSSARYFDYWCRLVPPAEHGSLLHRRHARGGRRHRPVRRLPRRARAGARASTRSRRRSTSRRKTFLHGLLVVEDRVSMAHCLEARVPFLDNELVDLARRIPSQLQCSGGEGKPLLRRAAAGLLPGRDRREAASRASARRTSPGTAGPTMDYIRAHPARRPQPLARASSSPTRCGGRLAEHVEGRVNHRLLIWSLLSSSGGTGSSWTASCRPRSRSRAPCAPTPAPDGRMYAARAAERARPAVG